MNQTDVFRFPFIGCREDGEPFEYMLLDIDQEKATIAIYRWMVSHFNLDLNEKIYLFIPSVLTLIYQFRKNTPGIVSLVKKDEQEDAFFYEISFNQDVSSNPNIKNIQELALSLPGEGSISEMLIQLVKDSIILKQGIRVYLKHLAPYFSRIVDYSLE
ncbi:MAG: hypothetical protein Q8K60_02240, partial [Parachlamydiaceae bacterium]|nr:hypothetical protein [Parachlamydiaceae bacterium]